MNDKKKYTLHDWPFKWFGFWGEERDVGGFPTAEECIDVGWPSEQRAKVVAYLNESPFVVAAQVEPYYCPLCGNRLQGSAYKYDGVWLWPVDLAHYVHEHSVRLPDSFLAHIREREYLAPKSDDVIGEGVDFIFQLPWPPDDQ